MALEAESIRAQVSRIVQHKNPRLSEGLCRLLWYLAEKSLAGEGDDLKEYVVGVDACGKPASYDPRQESVVRTQVARLRQRLRDYYHTDGINDPVLIDLPKGGFKVNFEERLIPSESEKRGRSLLDWHVRKVLLAASVVLAVAAVIYTSARPVRAERTTPGATALTPELERLWNPILDTNRPLVVCVAVPPTVSSAAGTASGAFLLGQFLSSRKPHVLLTSGDLLSLPEIMMDNVVFIGPSAGNRQLEAVPVDHQLILEPAGIRNLHPKPGEPVFLPDHISQSPQDGDESLALISHTPGINGNGEIVSLSGNHVSSVLAAVEAVTDPTLARTLVAKMKGANGEFPRYYQVVLKVKSMDEMPVEISYVLHRGLTSPQLASAASK